MVALVIARLLLITACVGGGIALALSLGLTPLAGALAGVAVAAVAIGLEVAAASIPLRPLLWTAGGAVGGLLAGLALG